MKKSLTIIIVLLFTLTLPSMATAFGDWSWRTKSLCEFPFGAYGSFQVKYDLRIYHHDYFNNSYPNGGIKLEFYVGGWPTAAQRDEVLDKIFWVRFTNKTNGDTHLITKANKFNYLGFEEEAEYGIWIGQIYKAVGFWKMVVATTMGRFTASFNIKEEYFEQVPAKPSDDILIIPDFDAGWVRVLSWELDSEDHSFSIVNRPGGDFLWRSRWRNTYYCQQEGQRCTMDFYFPLDYVGKFARLEHRIFGQSWPIMVPGDNCVAYDMPPGGQSRAMYFIKTDLPPPESPCDWENLGREKYVEVFSPQGFSCLGSSVCVDQGGMPQWTYPPAGCAPEDFNECGGTADLQGMIGKDCETESGTTGTFQCGPNPNDIFCVEP